MDAEKTLVVFDAVGTVINPVPDVLSIYFEIGCKFGSQLSLNQIGERFREGRNAIFRRSVDFVSSDWVEHELWRNLVAYVFSDLSDTNELFTILWSHFADPISWAKFDDVDDCLLSIKSFGMEMAIGSNFDSRLLKICDRIFGTDDFDQVFCSSQVGYRKPAREFYQHIALQYPDHRIVMVGDNAENDHAAPSRFGWEAILIDRKSQSKSSGTLNNLGQLLGRLRESGS